MIQFRRLYQVSTRRDKERLGAVLKLYQESFPYSPEYATQINDFFKKNREQDFEVVLLLAEGPKSRLLGFSFSFYFPDLAYAYLDYLVSDPARKDRGIGAALYDVTRDHYIACKSRGLFLDVPPDEKEKLREPFRLEVNKRRMAFYERHNARPIINTQYDCISSAANQGHATFLVYDDLGNARPLRRADLKKAVARFLEFKGGLTKDDPKFKQIIRSIKDDPILLRAPRYGEKATIPSKHSFFKIDVVNVGDAHQIHHLKEKGYVERPARIHALLKGMEGLELAFHKVKKFPASHIKAVHDAGLLNFLSKAAHRLAPRELLYPTVFPIRKPERLPKRWDMQGGYYCIDTFTPLTSNSYLAARNAAHGALSGAELILKGAQRVYVLCRPPGHHAEHKVFGGFCYLNSAAIAANFLSKDNRVAVIDIDYHHGNGTQNIFYHRKDVFFVSIHGHPIQAYPYFSGYSDEKGEGEGLGFNRNFPLNPGADDARYLKTLAEACSAIRRFKPEFLVVSVGYDIMKGDPTGTFMITPSGMRRIGELLGGLHLPILLVQEGGYSLPNLKNGVKSFLRGISQI
ncbi:MAG: histone deacetylase family protein [Candidatus Nitrohelix vancouverensis]|uniref:Histone deacetylase family protein n=1 Tax=Candidatus Nitrohelix vancouverensis TaxID=2705534 RepID=A0A7T0C0M1_9BACT|nr:MAG: histone deacetylase family protein [Candidatus Nitrohelix vancouverensis]